MERLSQTELKKRAKKLYFDRNKKIKRVFVDEFGRFSYTPENLKQINQGSGVKIIALTPDDCSKVNTTDVPNLTEEAAKKKAEAAKKKAEEEKPSK
jgi:hypothetical protein